MRRLLALAAAAVLATVVLILAFRWPFTESRIILSLARSTQCDVRVSGFRLHFFPTPGCTLDRVVFTRTSSGPPIATADNLELRSSWGNLLTLRKRLSLLRSTGLQVRLTSPVPPGRDHGGKGPQNTIAELVADGAKLHINGLDFAFPKLRLSEVGAKSRIGFDAVVDSPHPPGRIETTGGIGPFARNLGSTPVYGGFHVLSADLGRYRQLDGTLNARGEFDGKLSAITTRGQLDVTSFEVNDNGRPADLRSTWNATVDALTGDVTLTQVETDVLRTHLSASGSFRKKTLSVDFDSRRARLEDLARLTTKSGNSALHGPLTLRAHVELPAEGTGSFLQRLRLDARFAVDNGFWRKPSTQTRIDDLSARARREKEQAEAGQQAERVATDLTGTVETRNGVARFPRIDFRVRGATATGAGTYNLISKRVDIRGTVQMKADVSEATSGFKSILLKPFDALFRRRKQDQGATLPVSIVGTFPRPKYRVGLRR